MPASEALVNRDSQSSNGVDRILLQLVVADDGIRRVGWVVEFLPEEAAEVVLVGAIVDAAVFVLALEGVWANVLLTNQRRIAESVSDGVVRGPGDPVRDDRSRPGVVKRTSVLNLLTIDDSKRDRDPQDAVVICGSRHAGVVAEPAGPVRHGRAHIVRPSRRLPRYAKSPGRRP